jgi:hypothetical protein
MALRPAELRQKTSSFDDCAETDLSLNSEVGSEGRREIGYRLELNTIHTGTKAVPFFGYSGRSESGLSTRPVPQLRNSG